MPSRKPPPGKSRKPAAPKAPPVLSEVRERIERLCDPRSFIESGLFSTSMNPDDRDRSPCDGKIAGFGRIEGRDAATDWWIDRVSLPGAGVYELTHFGEAWNRVRSRAVFVLPNDPEECMYGPATQAPIEIDWRRSGDSWEIISLTVGAFSPLPDREEC